MLTVPQDRGLILPWAREHHMELAATAIDLQLKVSLGPSAACGIPRLNQQAAVVVIGRDLGGGGSISADANPVAQGLEAEISGTGHQRQQLRISHAAPVQQ